MARRKKLGLDVSKTDGNMLTRPSAVPKDQPSEELTQPSAVSDPQPSAAPKVQTPPVQKSVPAKVSEQSKTKTQLIALSAALALFVVVTIVLGFTLSNVSAERDALITSLADLLQYSNQQDQILANTTEELALLNQAHAQLEEEKASVDTALADSQSLAAQYQAQKFFFADELDWLGRLYGYTDLETLTTDYTSALGVQPPESCEAEPTERYVRWSPTISTMFVATPEKMGWPNYGWTIRENVTFGSDHLDEEGYIGSRGYELRYPLTGTWPLQELHTTINVYEHDVSPDYWSTDGAVETIELRCSTSGTYVVFDDVDETKVIYFTLGPYAVNVKLKYFYGEQADAFAYLEQAANVVIAGLTGGW
jgi:hypothetical protein